MSRTIENWLNRWQHCESKKPMLWYDCYAEYALEAAMAKTPEQVLFFLDQIWAASSYSANEEAKALTEYLERDGVEGPLEAWDWWYYAEKVRVEQYDLSEDEVRPYFSLDNVMQGAFTVAGRLFNIDFVERTDMPIYHPDVRVFEVQNGDSKRSLVYFTSTTLPFIEKNWGLDEQFSNSAQNGWQPNPDCHQCL